MSEPTRLLLAADVGGTHVGGSLARAAAGAGVSVRVVETRLAFAGPRWRRVVNWRLRDHRPPALRGYNRHLRRAVAEFRPHLLLTVGVFGVTLDTLRAARAAGAVTANWSTDDPWNRGLRSGRFLASLPGYDWAFTPRRANLGDLTAVGAGRVGHLPFAYDPALVPPPDPAGRPADAGADVLYVGGGDADRVALLGPLLRSGLRLTILGSGWDAAPAARAACRGQADPPTVVRATAAAGVSLCLVRRANRDGHVMRSYEIPAAGGCPLVEDTPDHRALFADTAVYFATADELAGRARELVADPARRAALAAAAHARVTAGGNTYADRLAHILAAAGRSEGRGRMIGFYWEAALALWVAYGLWLLARAWYGRAPVAGLLLAYYFNLSTGHLAPELLELVSRSTTDTRLDSAVGFEQCGWTVVGLLVGELLVMLVVRPAPVPRRRTGAGEPVAWSNAAVLAVVLGLTLFLFGRLLDLTSIPVLATVFGASNMLTAAGFGWLWWTEWSAGRVGRGLAVLAASLAVPFTTVVFSGFLGYGIHIVSILLAVVLASTRRKWWLVPLAVPAGYLALTVFVTYMAGRGEIRNSVWQRQDELSARTELVGSQFVSQFQAFDPSDPQHRAVVDTRLNQNYYLGLTVRRVEFGLFQHEYGATYANGFWALVPRAIWPDKPKISGGSEQVGRYTGLVFDEWTSVGEGHVLDLYANFGSTGVVVGMALVAGLLALLDLRAGREMRRGSFERFCPWFMTGAMLCNGSVGRPTELPPAAVAAFLLAQGYRLVARSVAMPVQTGRP